MYDPALWLRTGCLVALAGCAGGSKETRGPAGTDADEKTAVTLSLRVEARSADGSPSRVLMPADRLQARDQIALTIDVDRPAAVYLAQGLPDGKLELLSAQEQVVPAQPLRFPPQGRSLEPDWSTPEERLFVVAATRPFTQVGPALCQSLALSPCSLVHDDSPAGTRGVNDKPPPPPPPPPPPKNIDVATRTLGEKGYSARARSDRHGVAVLRFVLRHQP